MSTEAARPFRGCGIRVGCHLPDRPQGDFVDVSNLGEHEQLFGRRPVAGLKCLAVNPPRGPGVSRDLQVLAQLLVADGAAFSEERLDLLEDEGVALDRRGVVRFLVPDRPPDVLCLGGRRQAAHAAPKLGDRLVKPLVDKLAAWPADRRFVVLHRR